MNQITVWKGRTNIVPLSLGFDVSGDTITSQIRVDEDRESDLIAEWTVSAATDGTDGEMILTLDDSVTGVIEKSKGYMDIKRVSGGQPLSVFEDVIEVLFREPITV